MPNQQSPKLATRTIRVGTIDWSPSLAARFCPNCGADNVTRYTLWTDGYATICVDCLRGFVLRTGIDINRVAGKAGPAITRWLGQQVAKEISDE